MPQPQLVSHCHVAKYIILPVLLYAIFLVVRDSIRLSDGKNKESCFSQRFIKVTVYYRPGQHNLRLKAESDLHLQQNNKRHAICVLISQ